jgi:sorbitol/mannitol transport system substrate-binding protein
MVCGLLAAAPAYRESRRRGWSIGTVMTPSATNQESISMITRFVPALMAVLLSVASALAQQKTVTIATVNNPAMIELKKLSPKFEAANPNIKLNWVVVEENILRQRVSTDVSTGSGQFDLVFIGLYETPLFAKRGWLKEMADIPADYDLNDVFKSLRDGLSYQGKLYALPFYGESSMLAYRKDLFDEKGLRMPEQPTYDDIKKFADALTDKTKSIYGITLRGKPGCGRKHGLPWHAHQHIRGNLV